MSEWERELGVKGVQEGNNETENHLGWSLQPSTDSIGNIWEKEKVKADKPLKQFKGKQWEGGQEDGQKKKGQESQGLITKIPNHLQS